MATQVKGSPQSNWSKNQKWTPKEEIEPRNKEQLESFLLHTTHAPIRAVGSLHSFSDCLKTEGTMIRMKHLNQILELNLETKQITVEAGIVLGDLYEILRQHELALDGIPNTEDVTLGGAICNCTHGTGIEAGTICDSVLALEVMTANGDRLRVSRDAKTEEEKKLFEALLVGGGFFTVLYSATLQCVNAYKSFVINGLFAASSMPDKLSECLIGCDSVNIHYMPCLDLYNVKSRMRIPNRPFEKKGEKSLSYEKIKADMARIFVRERFFSSPLFIRIAKFALGLKPIQRAMTWQGILDWDQAELIRRRVRFVNVEYGIPIKAIDSVFPEVLKIVKKFEQKGYRRIWQLVMRPVKADRAGFLSPTKGRDTCCFDLSLQDGSALECKFFLEVEELLLSFGGRVSWARRFLSEPKKIRANYPEFDRYIEVMRTLDPNRRFSNVFNTRIFYDL